MVDYISNTTEVRRMARKVVPAAWTDGQIQSFQKKAYSHLRVQTRRFADPAFETTEPEYEDAVMCETLIAAVFLLNHETGGGSELPAIQQLWAEAQAILYGDPNSETGGLVDNTGPGAETGASSNDVDTIPYRDWGHNPDVPVPNKLTRRFNRSGLSGGVEGKTT